jgi:hypothetical protein
MLIRSEGELAEVTLHDSEPNPEDSRQETSRDREVGVKAPLPPRKYSGPGECTALGSSWRWLVGWSLSWASGETAPRLLEAPKESGWPDARPVMLSREALKYRYL